MKRAIPLLVLALLLAPGLASAEPGIQPEFPDDLAALAREWVTEAESALAPHADAAWHAEAEGFLAKARANADAGRVRSTIFDVETTYEIIRAETFLASIAHLASEAEKKSSAISQSQSWHDESVATWDAYTARLHEFDAEVQSLHGLEIALYSADIAATARVALNSHDELVPEFRKAAFSRGTVMDLFRASRTPGIEIGFASDILDVAVSREGLRPELDVARWRDVYVAGELARPTDTSGRISQWEEIAEPARQGGEEILSVAVGLAEQRLLRMQSISLTYGDAQSRGKDVVNDAARGMLGRVNRTSYDDVRAYGLLGVATADAIDQARFILGFVERGEAQLAFITAAWSTLDWQETSALVLADVSPVEPEESTNLGEQNNLTRYPEFMPKTEQQQQTRTPAPPLVALVAALAVAAVIVARRRAE